jgi:phytoene synthase
MNTAEALAECEAIVRRFDPDRYFASLFAPAPVRPSIFALYAFNHEVAAIGERNREPMMAAIRLQWWRETVGQAREARPRSHPVAIGLAELFGRAAVPAASFDALLDAREFDTAPDTFADACAFENYCDATSAGLMRICASVLGGNAGDEPFLRSAGIAYAIAGLLRAIPFHAARRKLYLPLDAIAAEGLSPADVLEGRNTQALKRAVLTLAERAREHMNGAGSRGGGRAARIAALPAALVPLYLGRMTRGDFDPLRDSADLPLFRRQFTLLSAATFARF